MEKPLISVVIPAYNHENYIQDTIKSVINQTYENIELIVVDDGSKDSSWAKIKEIEEVCKKRFANTHFETKQNEGTCKTLNRLLNLSKGEYVYIIASDDVAKPEAIELEYNFLSKNPDYSLCVGNSEYIDSKGKVCYLNRERNLCYDKKYAKYLTCRDLFQKHSHVNFNSDNFGTYQTLYISNYIPNGYLIRKSAFDYILPYTTEAPLEDWYTMLQIAKYSKMKYLDKILFSYRQHSANTMNNSDKMAKISKKTIDFEEKILSKTDESKVNKDVVNVKKYGAIYKKQGIPYVFQIISKKKNNKKIKEIMLFNIKILEIKKEF